MTVLDRRTLNGGDCRWHCDTNHAWREGMSDHGLDYNVA
jgi:hypothetical protein